jgi:hypothetical protein
MASETLSDFDALMQLASEDPRYEPAFCRALLEITVYAHVPISDDSGRLRFTMFARPDNGEIVLPFFTHEAFADECVGNTRRVVAVPGLVFFKSTLGSALILNPNHQQYVFYPEEVRLFLDMGAIAPRRVEGWPLNSSTQVSPFRSKPKWLKRLADLLAHLPYIRIAHAAETVVEGALRDRAALIALGVVPKDAERAMRMVLAIVSAREMGTAISVGVATFDPSVGIPDALAHAGIEAFYTRVADR